MTYPHGSARTGPQDASTSPPVIPLIVALTVNSQTALLVFLFRHSVRFAVYAPVFSLV